ncbi:MAG: ATP-binding cassette domain-containing protein [Candidatus Cloacimonetes bacterium]|nr:ATP-binding cassette domain-containing protein [Candidatus Cloacimonadota bacterium]
MALELKNAGIQKGGRWLFRHTDCLIDTGEKVVITGPSGSGKSTLLKSMLLFEALDEGSLWYGEQQLDASNIASYRQNCAYIGQKAPGFEGTVKQFVTLPYTFRANRNHAPQPDEIRRLLLKFDFSPEIQATQFDCLSGGEQQRMCIIQALLLRRTILMLDEITSSLDAANSARVIEEINQLKGCTVIVVSHDIQWLQAGMRKLTLRDGALFGREA